MSALFALLTARAPLASLAALLLAACLAIQTARIEGWPIFGGGLKQDVVRLQLRIAADELARAKAEASMLAAQATRAARAENEARAHLAASRANAIHTRTLIQRVPIHVSEKSDRLCVLPVGAVRLLDAAASGADPDRVAALVAPGQPDDAPSGIALSEAVTLLADNFARARGNADQLRHLQRAVAAE